MVYIVWAAVPESLLHRLGIIYYPSRTWAITLPSYAFVLVVFLFLVFISVCLIMTPALDSANVFSDPATRHMHESDIALPFDEIPRIYDLSHDLVDKILYT